MIVVVAPGQGSQTPGFLSPWLEVDGLREQLGQLGEAAGIDLIAHGTTSDEATIKDTKVAQPLIVAASIATASALASAHAKPFGATAGHSVGEFAAAAIAGVLSPEDAMRLVGIRGRAMADEAAKIHTGMAAVLGGELAELLPILESHGLYAANMNGGGQIVIAGESNALAEFSATPPAGIRVISLAVAGAFHTRFMQGAVDVLRDAATSVTVTDPSLPLYTNRDGSRVASGVEYRDLLIGQVANPVRWDLCMESFARDGVTGIIELAPAGALVGLARRALKGTPTVAIKTPDDLAAAIELLEAS
ncbi:[acyl-carrier-protein] S-malonyltransferase [Microbacteriaceae bacterium MWH-Ta3]|nr:[acyl-carrier-protein] S-malonyltransferase [Microbacteriaceae bacterium MWH-Ta3]